MRHINDEEFEKAQQELTDAFRKFLDKLYYPHAPHMMTSWVAVLSCMNNDGERIISTLANQDARQWETVGMLTYALEREKTAISKEALDEMDDNND